MFERVYELVEKGYEVHVTMWGYEDVCEDAEDVKYALADVDSIVSIELDDEKMVAWVDVDAED